jgi:hypothetical protein
MMNLENLPPLVSIVEARRILGGISHAKAYNLISRGELTRVNIDRRAFVTTDSISKLLEKILAGAR